jgi:hypothetical protein
MTELDALRKIDVILPEPEDPNNVSASDIIATLKRFDEKSDEKPDLNIDRSLDCMFLELLYTYPKSMSSRNLGPTLQYIIALYYEDGQPNMIKHEAEIAKFEADHSVLTHEELVKAFPWVYEVEEQAWSYDNLAILFCCAKSSICQAVAKYGPQAEKAIHDARLHAQVKDIALKELVNEEKEKLKLEQNKITTEKPNDRTNTLNSSEEDNSARE